LLVMLCNDSERTVVKEKNMLKNIFLGIRAI
jgi:hypothetical protein